MELDFTTLTEQQAFDYVVNFLRKQGVKSLREDINSDMCLYRGIKGRKCALGALMPDEVYDINLENLAAEQLVELCRSKTRSVYGKLVIDNVDHPFWVWLQEHAGLMGRLQNAHDCFSASVWEIKWQEIAYYFKLIYTPPGDTNGPANSQQPADTPSKS